MRVLSNAFFAQAEIVQSDRWDYGPLELVFLSETPAAGADSPTHSHLINSYAVSQWNQSASAGFARDGESMEILKAQIPSLERRKNPNIIMVPERADGLTELDIMLASLLPDSTLAKWNLPRLRASMALLLVGHRELDSNFAARTRAAFSDLIWLKFAPQSRSRQAAFSANSGLRILAGDPTFWMHRLYRLCLTWREDFFTEVDEAGEPSWKPLDALHQKFLDSIPEEDREKFKVRRPLRGGELWDERDEDDRNAVLDAAISGAGILESLDPVVEVLNTHRCHDDFAACHSWIKEDFERSFYSKRAKLKVDLVETVDDAPVWATMDNEGYEHALFRDVLSFLDLREMRLVLALRSGRTASAIASQQGLSGHASISRKIKALKQKVRRLIN
jgi:hypothetical protein